MIHVSDLMTCKVFALQAEDTLGDVRALMHLARIRHIPVTDKKGNFLGLVTHRDLLAYAVSALAEIEPEERSELESSILVGQIMSTDVTTVSPQTLLRTAAAMLYENKFGCLPVLEGPQLVGILTEADFLKLAIALLADE